jgi:dihydrofolate reductase
MTRPTLALIAAVAHGGVIGHDNRLLWKLPEDMQRFRSLTLGHPVIMGRRTWDSLPARFRPLPQRRNIVVTRNALWHADGAEAVASPAAALALVQDSALAFVIGGADLYAAALPLADELLLTELDLAVAGDTRFPAWDRAAFVELARESHRAAPPNDFDFAFVHYRRK